MARLSFRCPDSLVEAVDLARGQVPRERWLRNAIRAAVGGEESVVSAPRRERAASPPQVEMASTGQEVGLTAADPDQPSQAYLDALAGKVSISKTSRPKGARQ